MEWTCAAICHLYRVREIQLRVEHKLKFKLGSLVLTFVTVTLTDAVDEFAAAIAASTSLRLMLLT
jgi:hypothetical protein